jgi:hypothetical protein
MRGTHRYGRRMLASPVPALWFLWLQLQLCRPLPGRGRRITTRSTLFHTSRARATEVDRAAGVDRLLAWEDQDGDELFFAHHGWAVLEDLLPEMREMQGEGGSGRGRGRSRGRTIIHRGDTGGPAAAEEEEEGISLRAATQVAARYAKLKWARYSDYYLRARYDISCEARRNTDQCGTPPEGFLRQGPVPEAALDALHGAGVRIRCTMHTMYTASTS